MPPPTMHLNSLARLVTCLILPITLLITLGRVDTFNVETSNAQLLTVPSGSTRQFGVSLNFLPETSKEKNPGQIALLVGAPNQKETVNINNVEESALGVVYLCKDVLSPQYDCSSFRLDDKKRIENATLNEHFGSAVAILENGDYVICSPQWLDTEKEIYNYTFIPGRCSVKFSDQKSAEKSMEIKPYYHKAVSWKEYFVELNGRTIYSHGTSNYGISVDARKGNLFVAGVPGVLEGKGTVDVGDLSSRRSYALSVEAKIDEQSIYGYLGYSVKIGNFCSLEGPSDVCFAASAPNFDRIGMVKIIKKTGRVLSAIGHMDGKQAWSYFGYAMAACDVNSDGWDELLVGAPHQTDTDDPVQGQDQGRVYVYSRSETEQDLKEKAVLVGSRTKYARFGAAIQCIGDINLDGFIDAAVGAPGEDGGAGSLHIYLGSPLGLSEPASQRITPSSFPFPLVGLGFAISGAQSVPGSDFPIFAASSLQNGSVVVFQTRPVVEADVTLTADPNPVDTVAQCPITDIQGSCFMVELCLKGSIRGGQGATWDKKFNTTIMIDADTKTKPRKRALFRSDDGSLVESISKTDVNFETSPCTTYTAVVIELQVNRDRFKPVQVTANFELASSGSGNDRPILDNAKPQSITIPVTFKNDCGDNEMCDVDLSVTGNLAYTGHESAWGSLVVNETKELLVNLTIKNSKETSYWTVVEIEVNSSIPYARPAAFTPSTVTCQAERETAVEKVICNYYKPLKSREIVNIGVAFDTYLLPTDSPKVLVKATVRPQNNIASKEENPSDNSIELMTEIRIINDVTISSISTPAEVTIDHAKAISLEEKKDISKGYVVPDHDIVELNLTHKFLIQNEGPSFLLPTSIIFSVPFFLTDATLFVHEADVTISTEKDKISICKSLLSFESIDRVVTKRPRPTATTAPPKEKETTKSNGDSGGFETTTQTSDKATTTGGGNGFPNVKPNRRRRRSVGSRKKRSTFDVTGNVLPTVYLQSCTLDPQYCQKFECILPKGLAPDAQAEINVTLIVDKENIPIPEDYQTFYYGIRVEVNQPEHDLILPWGRPESIDSVTKFYLVQSGGKLNIWIIIGSIIGGLVLITVVILILWKAGFFKRNKHQQVAQWKRESQRKSRLHSPPDEGNNKVSD